MTKSLKLDTLTLIIIGILAFGSQILWLGFFQDDWNFVFYASTGGAQRLFEFLIVDGRPGATWVYALGFSIFGYNPALWQLFSLALRIFTAIIFLFVLTSIWGTRRYGNLIACIIFLIYPFFTLQPLSVAYAPHFVSYALYSLSILLMIQALEKPEKYLTYTISAILCTFLQLFTVEYFIGLELLRPLIIWLILANTENLKLRKVLSICVPYLLVLIFFIVWRSRFSADLGIRNNPISVLLNSGTMLATVIRNLPADFVLMMVSSWYKLINPELFVIGPIRNFYILAISLISGLCFYFLARPAKQADNDDTKIKDVFAAGILIYIAGMVSAYAVGYIVHLKIAPWNSRFSLPVLLGLALMVSGIIETVVTAKHIRHIFLACMIGLLIGSHNYNTFTFKSAWEKQERFYEQLIWRAPSINPGTALITDEEILGFMGDYPLSLAINSMYTSKLSNEVPYWFFAISESFNFSLDEIKDQLAITRSVTTFHGNSSQAIYFTYEPEKGQCLWILRPEDSEYKHLSQNMKKAALTSNINAIHTQGSPSHLFHQALDENKETWCYYYQKSDLARQTGEWEIAIALWKEAQSKGLRPDHGFEFIPFIEGYAHLGKWEEAFQLTNQARKTTAAIYFILCPTWERLVSETPHSPGKEKFTNTAYEILKCATP